MSFASSELVRQKMQRQRRSGTAPEMAIRRELHRLGLRYRVDIAPVADQRRRADLVFPRAKVAVFVDGCFWHGCAQHGSWPKANAEWWRQKIARNRERDADTDAHLRAAAWLPIRVWEHEDPRTAAQHIAEAVRFRRNPEMKGSERSR